MSQNKDFDDYSNYDDRGLQNQSSANKSTSSHQGTKSNEEYGAEKNPIMEKIKNSSIMKKVEKFINDNK